MINKLFYNFRRFFHLRCRCGAGGYNTKYFNVDYSRTIITERNGKKGEESYCAECGGKVCS